MLNMKKIITFFALLLVISISSYAQNSSPYWSVAGNNNATGISKLGTTNAVGLHVYTNNIKRMFIDSVTGNVGIGVVAPVSRLDINSDINTSGKLTVNGTQVFRFAGNKVLALGNNASASGTYNIAIGTRAAGLASASKYNIAISAYSLYTNANGISNIALGDSALFSTNSASAGYNIAIGSQS